MIINAQSEKGLKFRDRILITLSIPLIALLVLAFYAWVQFGNIYSNVNTIYKDRVIPLQELKTIADDYAILVIDAVNKANAGMISAENAATDIRAAQNRIDIIWASYLSSQLTPEETKLVNEAKHLFIVANTDITQALNIIDLLSGNIKGRLDAIDGPLYNSIDPISEKVTDLVDLQLTLAGEQYHDSQVAFQSVKEITLVIVTLALVLSLYAVWSLYRCLIRQVGGEPSTVVYITKAIASGNLCVSIPEKVPSGSIMDAVKKLRNTLNPVAVDLQSNASNLSILSDELRAIENSANLRVRQQQDETMQVATAMSEMSATVAEVANSAMGAADSSRQAESAVNSGAKVIEEVIVSIENLASRLKSVANSVSSVERDSEEIGGIVNVISGISEQTNLLALNAAIEAARAGDAGRGFAVVADEVRSLSIRTRESTEQIHHMIEKLRLNVAEAVELVNISFKQANDSVDMSGEAREKFEHIQQSVTLIMDKNTQIASAAEEQSQVADEIDRNVSTIRELALDVGEDFKKISSTEAQIHEVMKTLHHNAAYFKLS